MIIDDIGKSRKHKKGKKAHKTFKNQIEQASDLQSTFDDINNQKSKSQMQNYDDSLMKQHRDERKSAAFISKKHDKRSK